MRNSNTLNFSEADLRAHIASYPELYEDLAIEDLEERLEMNCGTDYCVADGWSCVLNICGTDSDNGEDDPTCWVDICATDEGDCSVDVCWNNT